MISEKGRLNQEDSLDTGMLLDAVTSLIDTFKQAGYNSPTIIQVDKRAFDKLLEEASKLYSSINVKNSIANNEFSLANIIKIALEEEKEVDIQLDQYYPPQKQEDNRQAIESKEDNREKQNLRLSATTTKYECPECGATFDTPAGHRKHYQAFHDKIEQPKIIEQAEI
jgi:folate-binding Fe-S cluster repair protein YgfZ